MSVPFNPHGGDVYNRKIDIDFSVSLNPFGMPQKVREAISKDIDNICKYPEYDKASLRNKLANVLNIPENKIILTAGASEGFMSIVRAVNVKEAVLFTPCFSGYEYALNSMSVSINRYPIEQMESTQFEKGQLIFLANPNNPTGKCIDGAVLESLVKRAKDKECFVVIDECFLPLSRKYNRSYVNLLRDTNIWTNVFIVRSFTKTFGMPGLRLGYIVTINDEIADKIERNLPEWNISSIAITAGKAALECVDELDGARDLIEKEKLYMTKELRKLNIEVFDSDTNFFLFRISDELKSNSDDLLCKLINEGILIRDCSNYYGLGPGYYRVSIKSHSENEELIKQCQSIYL